MDEHCELGDLFVQELLQYVEEPGATLINTLDLPSTLRCICKHLSPIDDASDLLHRVSSALETYERRRTMIRHQTLTANYGSACGTELIAADIMPGVLDHIHGDIKVAAEQQTKEFLQKHSSNGNAQQNRFEGKEIDVMQQVLLLADSGDLERKENTSVRTKSLGYSLYLTSYAANNGETA